MRKIKVSKITKIDNKYNVSFGSEYRYSFPSERKAKLFLGKVNKFLNEQIFDLNLMYGEVFSIYREYYLIIENHGYLRVLKQNFDSIEKSIDLSVSRSQFENGNYFTFVHLANIYSNLLMCIYTLQGVASKHSHTPTVKKLNMYINSIEYREKDFHELKLKHQKQNQINQNLKLA